MRRILTITILCFTFLGLRPESSLAQDSIAFENIQRLNLSTDTEVPYILPLLDTATSTLYVVKTKINNKKKNKIGRHFIEAYLMDKDSVWILQDSLVKSLNTKRNTGVTGISYTGDSLFLYGTYSKKSKEANGVSFTKRLESDWKNPKAIELKSNFRRDSLYSFYMHPSGELLLISMNAPVKEDEDLFMARKKENGEWTRPKPINGINSKFSEISPFLSHDKKTLFFASDRPGGLGKMDLYYSYSLDSSLNNWSKPVNIGPPINSEGFDAYLSYYPDIEKCFFTSDRDGNYSQLYGSRAFNPLLEKEQDSTEKDRKHLDVIASIHFDFDKYIVKRNEKDRLDSTLVKEMLSDSVLIVKLIGNTDSIGYKRYNKWLSRERAQAVKAYLLTKGIDDSRVMTLGLGEDSPVAPNSSKEGRRLNRRVDVHFINPEEEEK